MAAKFKGRAKIEYNKAAVHEYVSHWTVMHSLNAENLGVSKRFYVFMARGLKLNNVLSE